MHVSILTGKDRFIRLGLDISVSFVKVIHSLDMKKIFFSFLAKLNKALLPSMTKKQVDIMNLSKSQQLLLAWRAWVTKNSLD